MLTHSSARTILAPPFHSIMADIAYGFKGKTYKKSRTNTNICALVIVCLLSGATNILALEGIKTQDIVQALERHRARYGIPGFVYIDKGTQLKALQHSSLSLKDVDA